MIDFSSVQYLHPNILNVGSTQGSDTTIPLKDILSFATGADKIPPGGLNPSPSLLFYDGMFPLAST